MKKTFTIFLAVLLLLMLVSCGQQSTDSNNEAPSIPMASKEEQEAFDAACALIESGDYIRGIDALAGIPLYWEIQKKILETNRLLESETTTEENIGEPVKIDITNDNWSTYFEIKPYTFTDHDHWGEETYTSSGQAILLKEEYKSRYQESYIWFYIKTDCLKQTVDLDGNVYKEEIVPAMELDIHIDEHVYYLPEEIGGIIPYTEESKDMIAVADEDWENPSMYIIYKALDLSKVAAEGTLTLNP